MNPDQLIHDVIAVCHQAGRYLMEAIHDTKAELKGSNDLITKADKGSEKILLDGLSTLCPEAGLLSEEAGNLNVQNNHHLLWVIDPLDGTVNYSFGIPFYAISVALMKNHEPILGVVFAPAISELFVAQRGKGAYLNNKRITLNGKKDRLLRMLATSAGMTESDFVHKKSSYHKKLLPHYNRLRLMGSQALHLCYVATGRLDAALTNQAKLWDDAAGSLILEEAQGTYNDFWGRKIFPIDLESSLYKGESYSSIGSSDQETLDKIVELINSD